MKVLLVTHRYPPHTGGVETHVEAVATTLVERGHDVTVYSTDAGSDVASRTEQAGVAIQRFNAVNPGDAFYVAPRLIPAVRQADADIVHAHNVHALPLLFTTLAVGGQPLIATPHYHGASANGIRDLLLRAYRPAAKSALGRANAVVAVSDWEASLLEVDFGITPTTVPNGVEVERFATATPERRDRPYLLAVGRLERYKGIQHAIRAMSALPDYDLLVAGDGPYRGTLKSIAASEGVDGRVEFLGYVEDTRLPSLYAGATAHVTFSSFEAYGMTVAESLAAGTPCVVRESAALVDWVDRTGVVGVTEPTTRAVANAVKQIAGVTPTESVPSWETVTSQLLGLYRESLPEETTGN